MAQFRFRYGAHADGQHSYLDYVRMKDYLHAHEDDEKETLLPSAPQSTSLTSTSFWSLFSEEINRVDKSFMVRMGEINEYMNDLQELAGSFMTETNRNKKLKKVQETFLKRIATVLHNKICSLEDFRLLNRTAALKILNKYDKMITKKHGGQPQLSLYLKRMDLLEFGHGKSLILAKKNLEELYCSMFCDGVIEEAHLKLSLSKTTVSPALMQMVAGKIGVILALTVWLFNSFILSPRQSLLYWLHEDPTIYIYAVVGSLVMYRWFWGFSVYMWDKARVDYMLVLSLDPNKHMLHCVDVFSDAANLTILYLINMLAFHIMRYYFTHTGADVESTLTHEFSRYAWLMPLFLLLGTLARLSYSWVQPMSYGVFSTAVVSRMFRAPLVKVFLRDNFAANILCSFAHVLTGTLHTGCYFFSGSFLHAADPHSPEGRALFDTCGASPAFTAFHALLLVTPLLIRLLQCLRQLRDFKIAPWSQPPNNTTVDYDQQTSLDPSADPQTEFGYTWFSPMFAELDLNAGAYGEDAPTPVSEVDDLSEIHDVDAEMHGMEMGDMSSPPAVVHTSSAATEIQTGIHVRTSSSAQHSSAENTTEVLASYPTKSDISGRVTTAFSPAIAASDKNSNSARTNWGATSFNPMLNEANTTATAAGNSNDDDDDNDHSSPPSSPTPSQSHHSASLSSSSAYSSRSQSQSQSQRSVHSVVSVLSRHSAGPVRVARPVYQELQRQVSPRWAQLKALWVWPHAMNAFQYLLQIMVVLIGVFPPQDPSGAAYMTCFSIFYVSVALYLSYWDVVVDCQLLQFDSDKPLLRKKLYYEEYEFFYYAFIFLNPVLRLLWMISFTPYGKHPMFMIFEIARRSFWAVLRMEVAYIQELNRRRSH